MSPVEPSEPSSPPATTSHHSEAEQAVQTGLPFKDAKARLIDKFERQYWEILLEQTNGNVSAAARHAGIHRKSAEYLLRKLDLNNDSAAECDDD